MLIEFGVPLLVSVIAVFIFTQCILPSVFNRPWFPIFHKRGSLLKELETAREAQENTFLDAELSKIKGENSAGQSKSQSESGIPPNEAGNSGSPVSSRNSSSL